MTTKFRKQQRIKSPTEFKAVYSNRQWGNTKLLTFNALAVNHPSQLGITVSKKVSKLAVRRNELKRLVREFYRQHQHELHNTQLVVTVKPPARDKTNEEFRLELKELWHKVLKWQRWHQHQQAKSANSQN